MVRLHLFAEGQTEQTFAKMHIPKSPLCRESSMASRPRN